MEETKETKKNLIVRYISKLSCLINKVGNEFKEDAEITSAIRKFNMFKDAMSSIIIKKIGKVMMGYNKEIIRAKNDDGLLKIDFDEVLKVAKDADDKMVKEIFTKIQAYVNNLPVAGRIEYCNELITINDIYKKLCLAKN